MLCELSLGNTFTWSKLPKTEDSATGASLELTRVQSTTLTLTTLNASVQSTTGTLESITEVLESTTGILESIKEILESTTGLLESATGLLKKVLQKY